MGDNVTVSRVEMLRYHASAQRLAWEAKLTGCHLDREDKLEALRYAQLEEAIGAFLRLDADLMANLRGEETCPAEIKASPEELASATERAKENIKKAVPWIMPENDKEAVDECE